MQLPEHCVILAAAADNDDGRQPSSPFTARCTAGFKMQPFCTSIAIQKELIGTSYGQQEVGGICVWLKCDV